MISFDQKCGTHGTFDRITQKCFCYLSSHRRGDRCEFCQPGFQENENHECVRPPGCLPDSCGCEVFSTKSHCEPIGNCSAAVGGNGEVTCTCPINFAGPHCERCNIGYINYPECKGNCNPPCGSHGICNPKTNTCKCMGNYDPATNCTLCKVGYTGDDCAVAAPYAILNIIGLIFAGVTFFLAVVIGGWFLKRRYETQAAIALTQDILMDGLGNSKSETVNLSDQSSSAEEGGAKNEVVNLSISSDDDK